MSDIPWVKFYAGDFLNGVADLSPHEIAVYTVVLMRIYDEDRAIPNDAAKIARRCNMRLPQCQKAINSLVSEGKLIDHNGTLDNKRAKKEREKRQELSDKQARNRTGKKQKETKKVNKNNASKEPRSNQKAGLVEPTRSQKPEARIGGGGTRAREPASMPEMPAFLDRTPGRNAEAVHDRCCEIIGVSREKHIPFATSMTVRQWLNGGLDPEIDIYPTLQAVMANRNGDPPGSMAYFTKAVARAKAEREKPLPDVKPRASPSSPHDTMIEGFANYLEKNNAASRQN